MAVLLRTDCYAPPSPGRCNSICRDEATQPMAKSLSDQLLSRLQDSTAWVAVLGQGDVGLPLALRAADLGFLVVGYDVSEARVDSLWEGRSYVDDIPDHAVAGALA